MGNFSNRPKDNEMKMKTAELTGSALNWAVAKCEGIELEHSKIFGGIGRLTLDRIHIYEPSINWSQGGPIIERAQMELYVHATAGWTATIRSNKERGFTPLSAAMRCYVANKLGGEVDIPGELL
jgi:hypothetical protein